MLIYNNNLKKMARRLRKNMSETEHILWHKLKKKQILNVRFYRQKPLGPYIVDFYSPKIKLIIEVDGSQHFSKEHHQKDAERDKYFLSLGIDTLRFNTLQIFHKIDQVLDKIYHNVETRLQ